MTLKLSAKSGCAAGADSADPLPGRQPLPGLPEDLAAATSLPADDTLSSQPGAAPQVIMFEV